MYVRSRIEGGARAHRGTAGKDYGHSFPLTPSNFRNSNFPWERELAAIVEDLVAVLKNLERF